jgi:hypothetical protein
VPVNHSSGPCTEGCDPFLFISICVIAQGSKVVFLGDTRYQYDPFNYLLTTIELPRISQVVEASSEKPYLSIRLELDPNLVGSVMIETGYNIQKRNSNAEATKVSPLNVELLDALVRLLRPKFRAN